MVNRATSVEVFQLLNFYFISKKVNKKKGGGGVEVGEVFQLLNLDLIFVHYI